MKHLRKRRFKPIKRHGIGWALKKLRQGDLVARRGWHGKGMWLGLQRPDAASLMTLPYVYISTPEADLVPWLCSQTDLLAEDWFVPDTLGSKQQRRLRSADVRVERT